MGAFEVEGADFVEGGAIRVGRCEGDVDGDVGEVLTGAAVGGFDGYNGVLEVLGERGREEGCG
jgi:hypothetical protein